MLHRMINEKVPMDAKAFNLRRAIVIPHSIWHRFILLESARESVTSHYYPPRLRLSVFFKNRYVKQIKSPYHVTVRNPESE